MSGKNKLQGGVLGTLMLVQLVGGLWFTAVTGVRDSKFFDRSFIPAWQVSRQPPVQSLPQINLDPYKVCFFQQWRPGEFSFIATALSFGASPTSCMVSTSDFLSCLTLLSTSPCHGINLQIFLHSSPFSSRQEDLGKDIRVFRPSCEGFCETRRYTSCSCSPVN